MNIIEITNKFPTELDAVKHFEETRWGGNVKCPYCSSDNIGARNKDYRFHCKSCKKTFSVTTNTKLHDTRLPVKTWLYAFSIITDAKKGLSALQLKRNLDVSYPTSWSMYHKIRGLMEESIEQLDEIVEIDETYVGGRPRKKGDPTKYADQDRTEFDEKIKYLEEKHDVDFVNPEAKKKKYKKNVKRGRGTDKIPVVGIVERDGNVVAQVMKTLTYDNLKKMVQKHVKEEESILVTDEFRSYNKMESIIDKISIEHKKKVYSYKGVNTNTIESFWAIIKRGVMGQYHHVSPKYLPNYIQEFVFKFNNRKIDDMFETLVKNSMK